MKSFLFVLLLSFFCFTDIFAQNFLIYQVKGEVLLNNKTPITAGQRFPGSSKIVLKSSAAITIICPNYEPINLSRKGEYLLQELNCLVKQVSVTKKYWKAVYEEFLHPHESITESNRREYMENVGSVSRGEVNVLINPFMTEVNVYQQPINLFWKVVGDYDSLLFVLYTSQNNSLVKYDTVLNTDHFSVSNFQKYLQVDKPYYWSLKSNGKEMGLRKKITILSKNSYDSLMQKIQRETAIIQDEADRKFSIGFILEEFFLYAEALNYYKEAKELKPKNKMYMKAYSGLSEVFKP